jgi:hypothetical protein
LEYWSAELNTIEDEHEYENDKAHRISSSSYSSLKIQSIDHSEHATRKPLNLRTLNLITLIYESV